jgi:hypothetical protein
MSLANTVENVGQPHLRNDAIELCRLDQRVNRRRALAAAIGPGEQPVFAPDGNPANGVFSAVVVDLATAVTGIAQQCLASFILSEKAEDQPRHEMVHVWAARGRSPFGIVFQQLGI